MDLNSLTQVLFALVLQFHLQQERRLQMISNLWRNLYLSIFIHVLPSLGLFAGVLISTRLPYSVYNSACYLIALNTFK